MYIGRFLFAVLKLPELFSLLHFLYCWCLLTHVAIVLHCEAGMRGKVPDRVRRKQTVRRHWKRLDDRTRAWARWVVAANRGHKFRPEQKP